MIKWDNLYQISCDYSAVFEISHQKSLTRLFCFVEDTYKHEVLLPEYSLRT